MSQARAVLSSIFLLALGPHPQRLAALLLLGAGNSLRVLACTNSSLGPHPQRLAALLLLGAGNSSRVLACTNSSLGPHPQRLAALLLLGAGNSLRVLACTNSSLGLSALAMLLLLGAGDSELGPAWRTGCHCVFCRLGARGLPKNTYAPCVPDVTMSM